MRTGICVADPYTAESTPVFVMLNVFDALSNVRPVPPSAVSSRAVLKSESKFAFE